MKYILVRGKVAPLEKKIGTRCEICKHVVTTERFRSFSIQREYYIRPDNLNCCSNNVVYLFSCKTYSKQYTGSTESFRSRFNNYKSAHRSFIKEYRQTSVMLTLRMTNIMVWVIRKLLSLTRQRVQTIVGEESLFGSMNSTPFNQID